ncbi:hypothetical protein V6Z11_A01G158500 [Gossypium hirsutum]
MKAGSAAKLIVDALLQRFLPLARRRIETAQVQDLMTKHIIGRVYEFGGLYILDTKVRELSHILAWSFPLRYIIDWVIRHYIP